jgi:predicted phage-related endonuclease
MPYKEHNKIGGTAANIIAHGKVYDTDIVDLWRQFTGRADKPDLSNSLPVLMGQATEQLNADWLASQREMIIDTESATDQLYTAKNGFMIAQIDGLVHEDGDIGLFEAKHTGMHKKMTDIIELYYPQIQHYMSVMALSWAYLSVFFGNSKHEYEKIYADSIYIDALITKEKEFWDCVQNDVEPTMSSPIKMKKEEWSKYTKKVSFVSNNRFTELESRYNDTKDYHLQFKESEQELKDMMPEDAKEIYGKNLRVTRDRKGAKRVWQIKKEDKNNS